MRKYCITIDAGECIGYGRCVDLAPELFRLDGNTAQVVTVETDDSAALDAAAECPMSAIVVTEQAAA